MRFPKLVFILTLVSAISLNSCAAQQSNTSTTSPPSNNISTANSPKDTDVNKPVNERANLKDDRKALADYDVSLRLIPKDAETYNKRGDERAKLKDYQGAIADYTEAIRISPNYDEAYFNRGTALLHERLLLYKGFRLPNLSKRVFLSVFFG
jgi:tetratricopeptide (TPR) repeat protein